MKIQPQNLNTMLKLGKAIICIMILLLCCKLCGEHFSYVENQAYIYSINDSTIKFRDRYGSYYNYKSDSLIHDYCKQNRNKRYLIRKYDNGKLEIIQ